MSTRKNLKRFVWSGLLLVVVIAAAWALRPSPVPVTIAAVKRGDLTVTVKGEGRSRVKDLYVVSAPADGQLVRVRVEPGDVIAVDAVVAEIRPAASRPLDPRSRAQASAIVTAAKAALARAEAAEREAAIARTHAESIFNRNQTLARSGAAPAADAEHSGHEAEIRRRAADVARATVAEARAELSRAQAMLSVQAEPGMAGQPLLVRAPGTGKVLRVLLKSAGPVAAGTPLVEIGDTSNLEVSADLLSSDAAVVRVGAKAVVTGWGGEQAIAGSVRRIDPAAFTKVSALGLEEQRVPVVVDLKPPIPGALGHDYRVDVAIVTWDGQGILQLPATALFRDGEQWAVFLARGGRAHKTVVQLGPSDGTSTFVKDGVGEGDVIVTQPSDAIQDGTRIVELK